MPSVALGAKSVPHVCLSCRNYPLTQILLTEEHRLLHQYFATGKAGRCY